MSDFRTETERLILRDWREADWPPFFEGTNTPSVMEHIRPVMDEAGKADLKRRVLCWGEDYGHTFWVVERKSDREILGFCGIKRCDMDGSPIGEFELGWRLREDAWGKGYAREAALATRNVGFTHYDAPRLIALTVRRNEPSWRLMRRIGMVHERELDFIDPTYEHDGGTIIVHTITRQQWEASA
ncbi:GNAT family N-acetyltransferase [Erythrobacter sp. HA6-11]